MVLGSFYQLFAGTIVPNTFIRPPDSPGVIVFSRPPMSPMAFLGPPVGALAGNHPCRSPGHKRGLRPPIQGPSNAHKVCTCCQGLGVGVGGGCLGEGMLPGRPPMWSPCFGLLCGFVWFGLVLLCSAGHGSGSPLLQTGCSIAHLALSLCSLACLSVFGLLGLQMTIKGLPIVPQGACACLHDVSCMPVCMSPNTTHCNISPGLFSLDSIGARRL